MPKKCIICNKDAVYSIKDSSESYCQQCAEEHFGDLGCLTKCADIKEESKKNITESAEEQIA